MKKITLVCSTILSTVISSLLLTAPALAGAGSYAELSAGSAKNNLGVNFSGSSTFAYEGETETEVFSESETALKDKGTTSFGLRMGYQFNDYIAIELGHQQYGEVQHKSLDEYEDTINSKAKSSSISAGIKAILPLSDDFSLFSRAGMAKWDVKMTVTDSSAPDEIFILKQDDNDIYYGIGAEYHFNDTVSVGLEYSVLDMSWSESTVASESNEYYSYSVNGNGNYNYKVENIALLLTVSF